MKIEEIVEQLLGWNPPPKEDRAEITNLYRTKLTSLLEDIVSSVAGMKHGHDTDMEVYHDSGGGVMCENCGMGQYHEEYDKGCPTDHNKLLDQIASLIRKRIDGV